MANGLREPPPSEYVLGHSDEELHRLTFQARGDVAMLVAEIVGESGAIVGIDRAPPAIAVAQQRAADLPNVSFRAGDPAEVIFASPFDAVVGRYVLQFQPDPAELLRVLASRLRPGGIVAFHELLGSTARERCDERDDAGGTG